MQNTQPTALIIDDEPDIVDLLEITLGRMNIKTFSANDINSAKKLLAQHNFNLTLVDLKLPDGSGLDLICYMQAHFPNMPVTMITAYGTMEIAIEALKKGAFDFIVKPLDLTALRTMVNSALQVSIQSNHVEHGNSILLGDTPLMQDLRTKIEKLARTQAPILISGPSGSGKELVAKLIHELGPRNKHPFIAVNCGAIPQELMESEFFGHKKGSFTGAINDKIGLFQAADGGTLFLDEVGELPLPMQVKLLRAIQEKSVRAVGDVNEQAVDVRILSATNQDLSTLIKDGLFREDLFYRINVIEIKVPSLKQHAEDIPLLTQHIIDRLSAVRKIKNVKISATAIKTLLEYSFPGNIRELENILERAMTLCEGQEIGLDDLQLPQSIAKDTDQDFVWGKESVDEYSDNIERSLIIKALQDSNDDKVKAAELLGLSIRALRYKLKKLNIKSN